MCAYAYELEDLKMRRKCILLIAAVAILAASCSLDQLGNTLGAMGGNIFGDAPVDASGLTKLADSVGTGSNSSVTKNENGEFLVNTGNKTVTIPGNLGMEIPQAMLSDLSASDIAVIGQTLEKGGSTDSVFNAMSEPVRDEVVDGVKGTAELFSGIIDSISTQLGALPTEIGNPIKEISYGLKAIASAPASATKGDLILLQITQSLVFDALEVVSDSEGNLIEDLSTVSFEGEAVQNVINSAGVLIGFTQALQTEAGETAGNKQLIETVNGLLDDLEKYIDDMTSGGGESV